MSKVFITEAQYVEFLKKWMEKNPKQLQKLEIELDQAIASSASKKVVKDKRKTIGADVSSKKTVTKSPRGPDLTTYPQIIRFTSPNWETQCEGAYRLAADQ